MFKWHQSNNLVYVTFNIPANVTKQDIHAEITSSSIGLGVKGFGLNCEGTLFSSIKGSKWAIKDDTVQVQMDKQQTGVKWSHLLSEITESNAKAVVLFEYEATSEEELSLIPHQVIDIISKDDSGWWEGSKQQMNGVFPSNFVQEFPTDYQPPEDEDASAEATKEEEISKPISQVSRLGINISLGSMDELKNKLANRKTATYTSADIEEAHNNNNASNEESNSSSSSSSSSNINSSGGFVAVKPSGAVNTQQRQPGKVLLNNRQSTILSGVPPAIQSIPSSNTNTTTTTNTTPAVQPLIQLKPKQTNTEINTSGNSIPATTSKESQSTKEESSSGGNKITSLFKKPLKKITAISALTGSHSSNESSSGGDKNNSGSKTKAKVVYDFESKEPNELNLKKGDIIVVLAKDSSGWWQGINQSTQATGWFSNTFVEEIKEEKLPPPPSSSENKQPLKIVKSPPPKSSSSSQPQTVEAKLQSLSDTPKLETARKAGAAKGRKPPSRVRASYLLSDDEKAEREKLKQSFYSHVVSSQKELSMYDNNEDGGEHLSDDDQPSTPPSISRSGGSFTPTQQQQQQSVDKPIERPSKPPPPKRTAAMNSSLNNINEPPPPSNKPPPPPKSLKPLSTSDGYEPPSPPSSSSTTPITTSGEDTLQKSPTLQRKVAPPPQQQNEQDLPSSLVGKPPPLKPTPKPRAIQTNSESTAPAPTPSHEVNFKANLKPAKPSSPPIGNSQEIPTDTSSPPNATTPQPTPPPLKRVAKPPVQQQQPSNENIENITQFKLKPSPASPTSPSSPTIDPISTTTKPPARPPLKKSAAAAAPPSPPNEEATTTSPPTLAAKPKVALRNGPSSAPTSPLSQPQQPLPPSTHKRNLSNPNTTNNEKPPPPTKKPQLIKPLPQFNDICVEVSNICNEIQERSDNSQETTTTFKHNYPSLIDSFFSVAVCSNDGQFWGNDDQLNDHCVPMFQVIYPFLYSILCEEIGLDEVSKFISDQARPDSYDNQKPLNDQKKSHNPFTLAGQLITANLFTGKYPNAVTRIYQFLNIIQELVNCSSVSCDMVSYLSQKSETSDEILVGHLLKSSGLIKQPDDVLDFFYQINSIQLNSKQVSVLAATLANDGVCPFSQDLKLAPKNIISKTIDLIRICNSTPITSSIFDNNIDNINNSKIIPILSDSGVLMIIIPGLMGVSIISPCNNNNNNNNNNNDNFNHYPNNNHIEFCKKLCSILDQ